MTQPLQFPLHNDPHTFSGNLPIQLCFGALQSETEVPRESGNGVVRVEMEKAELQKSQLRLLQVAGLCGQATRTMLSQQI